MATTVLATCGSLLCLCIDNVEGTTKRKGRKGAAKKSAKTEEVPGVRSSPTPSPSPEPSPGTPAPDASKPTSATDANTPVRLPFNFIWGDSKEHLQSFLGGAGVKVIERRVNAQENREVWKIEGLLRPGPSMQYAQLVFVEGGLSAIEFVYGQNDWSLDKFNDAMGTLRRQLEIDFKQPGQLISRQLTTESPAQAEPSPSVSPLASPSPSGSPSSSTPARLASSSPAPSPSSSPTPTAASAPSGSESPPTDANAALLTSTAAPSRSPEENTASFLQEPVQQTLTGYEWRQGDTVVQLFYFSAEEKDKGLSFRTISANYQYKEPTLQ